MVQRIHNLEFSDEPRVHIPVQITPGQRYLNSVKVVEYPSLPGVIELWKFNVDGWDIFDLVNQPYPPLPSPADVRRCEG